MSKIIIRGSSLPRFMICTGSAKYTLPEEETEAAKEGTAAHDNLEHYFKTSTHLSVAKNGVTIDDDMKFYTEKYASKIPENAVAEVQVEYNPAGNVYVVGHVDYHWFEDNGETLVVMDYKYGHRIVDVVENWQLMGYAIGLILKYQKNFSKIKLMICQPRPHHIDGFVRSIDVTTGDLERRYMQLADRIEKFLVQPMLQTSDKCRYCPAAKEACPAFNGAFYNVIDFLHSHVLNDSISNENLSQMIKTYDRVKDIMKIKGEAIDDLAKDRLQKGEVVPGYVINKTFGNRKWKADIKPETFKAMTGMEMTKQVVKSPAEIEKEKLDEDIVEMLTEREFKGFKVQAVDTSALGDKIFGGK